MAGYVGNILVVYDMREPSRPEEVSRWWLPGQHVAAGETPSWPGQKNRLHHAMRCGDELWAAVWNRSEEHTSELQSLMRISYAVFCLKKKKAHEGKHNATLKTQPHN